LIGGETCRWRNHEKSAPKGIQFDSDPARLTCRF
jgi:hypothetical protein